MDAIVELSAVVRARRIDMGLTQTALAAASGLSRATINQLENGSIHDLSVSRAAKLLEVLGLSLSIEPPRHFKRRSIEQLGAALDIASRTASVSYKKQMQAAPLRKALLGNSLPSEYRPHMYALLDEAPVSLLASVVEALHHEHGVERAQVWKRMRILAREMKSGREIWQ